MIKTFFPLLLIGPLSAQIVINEISATQSDRLLRWDTEEQPFIGPGPAWWSPAFDSSHWKTARLPMGFDAPPIVTDLSSVLKNIAPSFYVRKRVTVDSSTAELNSSLLLDIEYNDGFIMWINGIEVARENMGAPKTHLYHDQVNYRVSDRTTASNTIDLGPINQLLSPGENTIAIQVNNRLIEGNMRLDFELKVDASPLPPVVPSGSSVAYLPGLVEPGAGLFDPATLDISGYRHDTSDWIELLNHSAAPVNLTGWTLTDDSQELSKWTFPAGTSIPGNGYLIVFADNPDSPIPNSDHLHANFKLSGSGEFLGLYNSAGTEVSSISPLFPKQSPHYTYGLKNDGTYAFLTSATPGKENTPSFLAENADAPDFDLKGGFYESAITVTLTSETPDVVIRYTTDGTEPTLSNGITYSAPLPLGQVSNIKGHVIRARSFKEGLLHSKVKTHTYLIGQDERLLNNPSLIYAGDTERSLYDPYGALAVGGGSYSNNQWVATGVGDYNNIINRGRSYERPIHAEFYFPDGSAGFRSDVGLRVSASSWSRPRMRISSPQSSPWDSSSIQKPSFNLYFRDDYGNPAVNLPLNGPARGVNSYSQFRVRAGKNDIQNPFITDEFVRRLSRDMGNPASVGVINSLYVNGELKGFYNMVERLRAPFLSDLHGTEEGVDWDILAFENGTDNVADGTKDSWNDLISRIKSPVSTENWERILEVADVESIADYYLLNIYMGMWDWPHNNWIAAKERSPEGRFRLYVWDAEGAMGVAGGYLSSIEIIRLRLNVGTGEIKELWQGLNRWNEFKLVFADRVHKHLFNGGLLDDRDIENSHLAMRWDELAEEITPLLSLIRNQTHSRRRFENWTSESSGRRRYLFGPARESFKNFDLWPELTPPVFSKMGGSLAPAESLKMTNDRGLVYYTTDGTDPRHLGGIPNPNAISQPGSLLDIPVIPLASEWKYNFTDGDLGTAWLASDFDDSGWSAGVGPLGYGGIRNSVTGESITIGTQVNSAIPRAPVTYFRRPFEISNKNEVIDLKLTLMADAGSVVYLNGVEAFRDSNIPDDATYEFEPSSDSSDGNEGDLDEYPLDINLLINGTNTVAVAHYNRPGSSDMVFELGINVTQTNPNNPPVTIDQPTTVMARSLDNGVWSALTEASFTVDTIPANASNLAVSEILYNPIGASTAEMDAGFDDGDFFEYLRLHNISGSSIDLSAVRFTSGIGYDFSNSSLSVLSPNGVALLVKDIEAFRFRFGNSYDHLIAGTYTGQLSNGGETIRLVGEGDTIIHEFEFETSSPWPDLSALDGHSILINDAAGDHDSGSNWRPSPGLGGIPDGRMTYALWETDQSVSGALADADSDDWNNLLEFALGTSPSSELSSPSELTSEITTIGDDQYLVISYQRANGERAVTFSAEISNNLESWSPGGVPFGDEIINPDGSITGKFRHPDPIDNDSRYLRLKVTAE